MLKLDSNDLQKLIRLLTPVMRDEPARRALLTAAFVNDSIMDNLSLSGSMNIALPLILAELANYGLLSNGDEALLVFLQYVSSSQAVGEEQQSLIADLITQIKRKNQLIANSQISGAKYQDLYSVTVGICGDSRIPLGTGILVGAEIITIGRVVHAALNDGNVIYVSLPRLRGFSGEREQPVEKVPNNFGLDDIVRLTIGEHPDVSAKFDNSCPESSGNSFRVYGFTGSDSPRCEYIDGEILGHAVPPLEIDHHEDTNCFTALNPSKRMPPAMVGSAVLDLTTNLIIGIVLRHQFNPPHALAIGGKALIS